MITLRLVDVLENKVLAENKKSFKSVESAWAWLKKQSAWKRGGLVVDGYGDGPAFHIHAIALDEHGNNVTRWIFMERRTMTALIGPNGEVLDGSEQITSRQLVWIQIKDEALAYAFAHGITP